MTNTIFEMVKTAKEPEVWERLGRTWAILCVDSCGFTRTTQAYGIVYYLRRIAQLRELCFPVLQAHGCLRHNAHADNLFATFENPKKALEAALALNRTVTTAGLMLSDAEPFRICCGIGYGKVLDAGSEGAYGSEVNLAYKLGEDIAEAGEILLTEQSYQALVAPRERFEKFDIEVSKAQFSYYKLLHGL